ncbi:hypothetical protein OI18_14825 [Flavihumibacter solisilvae]|uniref:Outer membrane lipoprotein-sorting protein n=2 Tax=Flavihumibacter solisilvae TaxID=1349421 RepID=A0A0C1II28_9BACT|nr:hypothetical protein OI18_14825 [Flavihumibacter solisilvae]
MNMKTLFLLFISVMCALGSMAQKLKAADRKQLQVREDSLKAYADSMINARSAGKRFLSDSNFVRSFVRALKTPYSFDYPFDSVTSVSMLYPADSTFRIMTWQLKKDEYMYLQKGAIQMRTTDGSLRLFPLFDASMFTAKPIDSVRSRKNWIGAIYYKVIQKEWQGRKYYTLLGFDGFTVSSNRKWMEVLSFDPQSGEPVFGGPYFVVSPDSAKKSQVQNRFSIEYKKEASTTFNYSEDKDMVIFDHLISESDEPNRPETFIPDGDFEGFQWKDGKWVQIKKVFTEVPDEFKNVDPLLGNAPADDAIRDKEGNIDEKKLEERSRKNDEKSREKVKPKPKKTGGGNQ